MVGFALLGTFQRDRVCRSVLPGLTVDKHLGRLIRRRAITKTAGPAGPFA